MDLLELAMIMKQMMIYSDTEMETECFRVLLHLNQQIQAMML